MPKGAMSFMKESIRVGFAELVVIMLDIVDGDTKE